MCVCVLLLAVKCNDDPAVLSVLAQLGTGFDCASKVRMTLYRVENCNWICVTAQLQYLNSFSISLSLA